MKRLLIFIFTCCVLMASASASKFTPLLQKLNAEASVAKKDIHGLPVINRYLSEARRQRNDSCLLVAYKRKTFYYIVTAHRVDSADITLKKVMAEHFTDQQKMDFKTAMIFYCQYAGNPMKSVALCRDILRTSKDKAALAEAKFNITLLYYNCGMLDQATKNIIDLCKFSETITDKSEYHYSSLVFHVYAGMFLTESKKFSEARIYLQRADSILKYSPASSPAVTMFEADFLPFVWGLYYSAVNDNAQFWKTVSSLQSLDTDAARRLIYEMEFKYYLHRKDYAKAKVAMDKCKEVLAKLEMTFDDVNFLLFEAQIASGLGNYKEATHFYELYQERSDSINLLADQLKAESYSVQLDLDKANIEKSELRVTVIHYRAQVMTIITIVTIVGIILAVLFIVYLRKVNEKLRSVNAKLKNLYARIDALGKLKTELIMSMSRELRGPLNTIMGFAQIFVSKSSENKQIPDIVATSSNHITKILDDVCEASELETCNICIERVNVNECCETAIAANRGNVPENVKLIYEPSDENLIVNCNQRWLVQILKNLLDNACKFTTEGYIRLRYTVNSGAFHLSVEDTGCGIPSDKTEWVFEHFAKINEFSPGTGLGLPVCRMIALKLGGSVSVDSSYHAGCKVDVLLPCKAEAAREMI